MGDAKWAVGSQWHKCMKMLIRMNRRGFVYVNVIVIVSSSIVIVIIRRRHHDRETPPHIQ